MGLSDNTGAPGDSFQGRRFVSGAVRDTDVGKPRMDLLPYDMLMRLAAWYGAGAEKYGANNWRKGQPKDATYASLMRHLSKYYMGHTDEDHLAAVIWNAFSLMNIDMYFKGNPDLDNLESFPKQSL